MVGNRASKPASEEGSRAGCGCLGLIASLLLMGIAALVGKFLGGPPRLEAGDRFQLEPGSDATLLISGNRRAFKGLHQVTQFEWWYEPVDGPDGVVSDVVPDNTEPWELPEDAMVLLGPAGIPVPGQRESIRIRLQLFAPSDARVGASGVVHWSAVIGYATFSEGQAAATRLTGDDIEITEEQFRVTDADVPIEIVDRRITTANPWNDVREWMDGIAGLGVLLFGAVFIWGAVRGGLAGRLRGDGGSATSSEGRPGPDVGEGGIEDSDYESVEEPL